MEEQSKSQQTKVVTANKLLPSILHGSSPLLPPVLNGSKPKEEPGKALLLESIEDDSLWYNYIRVTKDGELLTEACRMFPNYWKVHHRCALFHLLHKRTRQTFEVYTAAVKNNDDYTLHVSYLKFLYHMASVHEYIAALFTALDKVGLDLRADPLWKELITVLVKIYNCKLMERNVHTGLLPNLFPSESVVSSAGGPLYPSEAEQVVFRGVNTLDKKEQTYLQLYSDVNHVRKMFQRWLKTPTNNLKHAWDGYSMFENIVSAANVLCTKLLADAKIVYEASVEVYEKLALMYRKVLPAKPACKRQLNEEQKAERDRLTNCWIDIIKYEEINPLNLPTDEMVERIAFTFKAALTPHVFSARLWYMYFQFLLANSQQDKAISELKIALKNFLGDDSKMQFVLAAYLDDLGSSADASIEFKRLVDIGLKLVDEGVTDKEDIHLRQLLQFDETGVVANVQPIKLIHYLNYIRRNMGCIKWREDLHLLLTKGELRSWELYWYAADTELRCFRDLDAAANILNQAQHSMPFDMYYTILHIKFLLNMGRMVDARVLLTEILVGATVVGENKSKYTAQEKMELWYFWLHAEYFYGSKAHFTQVQSLFVQDRIANEVGLDTFAEKSKHDAPINVRQLFGDIGPTFVQTHMDSSKRVATEGMNSVVELRRRLFCGGLDYDELDPIFMLGDHQLAPKVDAASSTPASTIEAKVSPSNFTRRSATEDAQRSQRVSIVRPNVSDMSALDPASSGALEAIATLHGSKRPVLPEEGTPIDAVATPPKVLFDLLRVLPTPSRHGAFPKMYANSDAVEYLLRSLDSTTFEHVPLNDYEPIPVNQLLHVKSGSASDGPLLETTLESGVENSGTDLNSGLFSILRFLEPQPRRRRRS
ncbi:mRNA 3'-end-processing protein rna14 [Babesia sp. Xinjiang]|uniref:mRNA 3'-end-processing protein rna14 n=1 Tax=Babesia sp. Xinjiang TaxID=462227 RepID=UPI000A21714D|nr:mRNA 3'-end-processing protein rna14 [Babesia sp. Xinjiang]ORM40339.1 mRNA 3'-end-processing protein rna14 [Babesia sp. Xinjiang]